MIALQLVSHTIIPINGDRRADATLESVCPSLHNNNTPRSPLDHEGIFLRASTKARGVQINDVTVEILNDLAIRYDQLQDEDD